MSTVDGLNGPVDKTIDIIRHDGAIVFRERGDGEGRTTIVVGQTVRWENSDTTPHRLVSVVEVDGTPLIDTGVIRPGGHSDVLIDVECYSKAGGKPANVVSIVYRCADDPDSRGELQVLSAARRERLR